MTGLVWQNNNKEVLSEIPNLVELVWQQIHKDFALEALTITEIEVVTLDDIYKQVYPEVSRLIKYDFNALMRLLYRIDISENAVRNQMALMPDDTPNAVSTLIVKREIKKIVLRKQFSAEG